MNSIVSVLGKNFKGTVVEDPILEPYFITNSAGAFTVSKKRVDQNGLLKYSDICYPSSFKSCLITIAKEKQHTEGKVFNTIQEYIDSWKEVSNVLLNACKVWNVEEI